MLLDYIIHWKVISKSTVKTTSIATKSCLFKRPFGNLGIGILALASSLEVPLALALQKFYL